MFAISHLTESAVGGEEMLDRLDQFGRAGMALIRVGEQSDDLHLRKVWPGLHGAELMCPQFVRHGIAGQDADTVGIAHDASLHSFNATSGLESGSRQPLISKVLIKQHMKISRGVADEYGIAFQCRPRQGHSLFGFQQGVRRRRKDDEIYPGVEHEPLQRMALASPRFPDNRWFSGRLQQKAHVKSEGADTASDLVASANGNREPRVPPGSA